MRLQNLQNNFVCLFGKSDRGREWPWQSARALQNVFMLSNVSSSNISEWHETPFSSRWSCCFSKPGGSEVLYKAKPRTANMNIRKMEKACLLLKWSGKQVSLPMTQWEADFLLFFNWFIYVSKRDIMVFAEWRHFWAQKWRYFATIWRLCFWNLTKNRK